MYRLHADSGKVAKVLDDPLMKPKTADSGSLTFGVGINKMTVTDGHLYFTNTDQNIFARITIHEAGTSKGFASEVIAHLDSPTGFTSDRNDMYFAQLGVNLLARVRGNQVSSRSPLMLQTVKMTSYLAPQPWRGAGPTRTTTTHMPANFSSAPTAVPHSISLANTPVAGQYPRFRSTTLRNWEWKTSGRRVFLGGSARLELCISQSVLGKAVFGGEVVFFYNKERLEGQKATSEELRICQKTIW